MNRNRNNGDVRQERSAWRDLELSLRHRRWGFNAPLVDVDWLICDYDLKEPVALVEYKSMSSLDRGSSDPNRIVLQRLAGMAGLPLFQVLYGKQPWWFEVTALTPRGNKLVAVGRLTEEQFVDWVYSLKGRTVPDPIRTGLSKAPTSEKVTEEQLREVGRMAFGIRYDEHGHAIR